MRVNPPVEADRVLWQEVAQQGWREVCGILCGQRVGTNCPSGLGLGGGHRQRELFTGVFEGAESRGLFLTGICE